MWAPSRLEWWSEFVEVLDALESAVTILAIAVGGFWTYMRFVRGRLVHPWARCAHRISDSTLPSGRRLVVVALEIENAGGTLLSIEKALIQIRRLRPLSAEEEPFELTLSADTDAGLACAEEPDHYAWPGLAERWLECDVEIEPGERSSLIWDCPLPQQTQAVRITTYLPNQSKATRRPWRRAREIGWMLTTDYDLQEDHAMESHLASDKEKSKPSRPPAPKPRPIPSEPNRQEPPPPPVQPKPPRKTN